MLKLHADFALGFRQDKQQLRRSFTVTYATPLMYASFHMVMSISFCLVLMTEVYFLARQHTQWLRCWLRGSTTVWSPQWTSMTTVWI